jgi:hypothetical protein
MTDQTLNEMLYEAAAMYLGGDVSGLPFNEVVRRAAARYISGAGGVTDLSTAPAFFDEFLFASTESGEIGELGWGFTNGTWNLVAAAEDHPGICRRTSTGVANAIASAFPGGGGTAVNMRFDQLDEISWVVRKPTTVANVDVRIGLANDFTVSPPINGAYFEKLTADTNWFGVGRVTNVETRTDTGVAATADAWVTLKLRRVSATVLGFSVNGGTEIQVAGNMPIDSTSLLPGFHIIPTSSNARSLDVDAFAMLLNPNNR